jgi:4-amino-4-deoxy-L-arabinose transferase-like glycosyltransferase
MRRHLPLTGILVLAALLRLVGLGSRSLWLDEGAEYDVIHGSLGHLFERVADRESTPPLSYLYEWAWTKAIGTSEFALRLPFALLGIALVVVMYAAARSLAGRRAGLIAAALAACNPMLVWHAQDARAYTPLALALAGTIWALAERRAWWWAALATGALATHHFAIFMVAPEAAWLLRERGRAAWRHVAVPAVALVPLALLAAAQSGGRSAWIAGISLFTRLVQIPVGFLEGYQLSHTAGALLGVCLLAAVLPGLLAAWGHPAGRTMLGLATIAILLPLAGVLVGRDYLLHRNVIGALVAVTPAVAIGCDRLRFGMPLVAGVCAIWIAITVATAGDPKYGREDWRGAIRATTSAQAVLLVPDAGAPVTMYYRPALAKVDRARVSSVAMVRVNRTPGSGCRIQEGRPLPPAVSVRTIRGRCWQVDIHRWAHPTLIVAGDDGLLR